MSFKTALRTVFFLCTLLVGTGSVLSQELSISDDRSLIRLTQEPQFPANVPHLGPQVFVAVSGPACACHNLAGVSVICEDCDRETRANYCHTHDRACQDAALKGGIREFDTFFCTTPN